MRTQSLLLLFCVFLIASCLKPNTDSSLQQDAKADQEFVEQDMSKGFESLRNAFLNVTSRDQVNGFMTELEAMVKSPDAAPDVKFTGSLLLILQPLEAMTYRGVNLIKSNENMHSLLLSHVMGQASLRKTYYPTPQGEAFFRYLTEPIEKDATAKSNTTAISTMEDVQAVLMQVKERLDFAYHTISALDLKGGRLLFDQKIAYGTGSFGDGIKRFYEIGDAEREATLASLKMSIHGIQVFNAYNLHDLPEIIYKLGRTIGLDGFGLWKDIDGFPSCRRTAIVRQFPNFWKRQANGQTLMTDALASLNKAAQHAKSAWDILKSRDATDEAQLKAFDQMFYAPARQSMHSLPNRRAVENMLALLQGEAEMRSPISGETVKINLPAFYSKSPSDLKALLPTGFTGECSDVETVRYKRTERGLAYRDYLWGSATTWSGYDDFFPGEKDIAKVSRVLVQSWGGWLGTPLIALAN